MSPTITKTRVKQQPSLRRTCTARYQSTHAPTHMPPHTQTCAQARPNSNRSYVRCARTHTHTHKAVCTVVCTQAGSKAGVSTCTRPCRAHRLLSGHTSHVKAIREGSHTAQPAVRRHMDIRMQNLCRIHEGMSLYAQIDCRTPVLAYGQTDICSLVVLSDGCVPHTSTHTAWFNPAARCSGVTHVLHTHTRAVVTRR